MSEEQTQYKAMRCVDCQHRDSNVCRICDDMHLFCPDGARVVAQCTEKPDISIENAYFEDCRQKQSMVDCGQCRHEDHDPDDFPCKNCEAGSKFEAKEDTIKKNNHEPPPIGRGKALKKALEIINGERQDSYGNPEDSFALIAKYWNAYLIEVQKSVLTKHGFDPKDYDLVDILDARKVSEMMALFKIARMSGQRTTPDNYADAAGYIGIAGDMV